MQDAKEHPEKYPELIKLQKRMRDILKDQLGTIPYTECPHCGKKL